MSDTLSGVTFLAFANGSPDVITAIVAGGSEVEGGFRMAIGFILGAGYYNRRFNIFL